MPAKKTVRVKTGTDIRVYEKSIVVGASSLYFNREIEKKDIAAVKHLINSAYEDGKNSKASQVRGLIRRTVKDFMSL